MVIREVGLWLVGLIAGTAGGLTIGFLIGLALARWWFPVGVDPWPMIPR